MYRQLFRSFSSRRSAVSCWTSRDSGRLEVHLGVPPDRLDVIQQNNRNNVYMCEDCLREMFLWWLRNGDDITVKKLAKAVHEVGHHQTEAEINRKFGT